MNRKINFQSPSLNFKNINKANSKNEILNKIKSDSILVKLITNLKISDSEIFYHYTDLLEYAKEQKEHDKLFYTNVNRKNGRLVFYKVLNQYSSKIYDYLRNNNIKLRHISHPIVDIPYNELKLKSDYELDIMDFLKENNIALILNNKFKGFFLYGDAESSRSLILSAIANDLSYLNKTVSYLNINNLDTEVKSLLNSNNSTQESKELLDTLTSLDILILDELGLKKYTNWFLESFIEPLLSKRFLDNKITIFGSYYTLDLLKNNFFKENHLDKNGKLTPLGSRIFSLIKRLSNESYIWVGGSDE
ncbi:hypothetical protein [Mycoplasmopsis felis]|uniref:hypothetical protein n=1 Tax=Mycoplasmopsis felis TaxID=33923 RepID=UPI002B003D0A|nr:hypothetical protein [Mycoplasmopsis felis]WQQ04515.1 hypothetical protein RRG55_02955 [Mycoplasmopsis felis]